MFWVGMRSIVPFGLDLLMVDVYTWCVVPLHKSTTLALSVKNMYDGWIASRDCDSGHRAQFIKAWLLYLKGLGYM